MENKGKTFIESYIKGKKFEDCRIPFSVVATNLKTGEIVILNKGEMTPAIRASISLPLIFKPVEINKKMLVDAGLSSPVPAKIVRDMGADIVIAVNLDKHYYNEKSKHGWYDVANNSLNILRHHLALLNMVDADIAINIDLNRNYWYEFVDGQDKILAGEKAIKKILPQLKELIRQKSVDFN